MYMCVLEICMQFFWHNVQKTIKYLWGVRLEGKESGTL